MTAGDGGGLTSNLLPTIQAFVASLWPRRKLTSISSCHILLIDNSRLVGLKLKGFGLIPPSPQPSPAAVDTKTVEQLVKGYLLSDMGGNQFCFLRFIESKVK